MANIIPSEQVGADVQRAVFGGAAPPRDAGRPMDTPRVDRHGAPLDGGSGRSRPALPPGESARPLPPPEPEPPRAAEPAPKPEPRPEPAPPPKAEPPVFEVPGEILQGVYDQAVAQGLEDGKNQVLAELTVLQERYAACVDQLVGVSKELQAQNRVQLLDLACIVAEKLVRGHLRANPRELLALVEEVLGQVEGDGEVIISVGPDDHAYFVERRAELAEGVGGAFTVKVVADNALEYGDFRVETATGSTDGRVATRMAEVERALRGQGDGAGHV